MTAITGNTYPVKDQLKAIGGKWNPDEKAWMVPDNKADDARKIVTGSATATTETTRPYRPQVCKVCGVKQYRNARGYLENKILKSGECFDCYEERKGGY